MRAVVDADVWAAGLIFPGGSAGRVLEAVRVGAIEALAGPGLVRELVAVLRRPSLGRYGVSEADVEAVVAVLGPPAEGRGRAEDRAGDADAPAVRSALAGHAQAIVTADRALLDDPELADRLAAHGVLLLTPAGVLERLGDTHGTRGTPGTPWP